MIHCFILFRQGDRSNYKYKQNFKEQAEVFEAYNRGFLSGNSPVSTSREIKFIGLDVEKKGGVETERSLERSKYLTVALLLRLDQCRCGNLILDLKNNYAKQQKTHPKMLTDMYSLMVVFNPAMVVPVTVGHNEGLNFSNVATDNEDKGGGDAGSRGSGGGGARRKIECWNCGDNHLKWNFPKQNNNTIAKVRAGKKITDGKVDVRYG